MLFVGLAVQHVVIKLVLKSEDQRITECHLCVIHTSFTEHIKYINFNPTRIFIIMLIHSCSYIDEQSF